MSTTISNTTSSNLASALLSLSQQTQQQNGAQTNDPSSSVDLDTLDLSSGSSLASLEEQAQEIAAQNQNSVISTSEEALAANLSAVSALTSDPTTSAASQSNLDPTTAVQLL